MIMPILPMFLESLGATGQIVGLVGGIRDSISGILKVLCGYWSDKTGKRKIFVYAGYGISSVFKLLLGLSKTAGGAVVFSSMERVGKGLRTAARDAIIAESVDATQRGKSFGIHRGMDSAGAVLGAGLAFIFLQFTGLGFSAIIIISAVIGLASLVPLRFVSEPETPRQNAKLKLSLCDFAEAAEAFHFCGCYFRPRQFQLYVFCSEGAAFVRRQMGDYRPDSFICSFQYFSKCFSCSPRRCFQTRLAGRRFLFSDLDCSRLYRLASHFAIRCCFILFCLRYTEWCSRLLTARKGRLFQTWRGLIRGRPLLEHTLLLRVWPLCRPASWRVSYGINRLFTLLSLAGRLRFGYCGFCDFQPSFYRPKGD